MKAASEIFSEGYIFVLQSKSSSLTDLRGSGTTHAQCDKAIRSPALFYFLETEELDCFHLLRYALLPAALYSLNCTRDQTLCEAFELQ